MRERVNGGWATEAWRAQAGVLVSSQGAAENCPKPGLTKSD